MIWEKRSGKILEKKYYNNHRMQGYFIKRFILHLICKEERGSVLCTNKPTVHDLKKKKILYKYLYCSNLSYLACYISTSMTIWGGDHAFLSIHYNYFWYSINLYLQVKFQLRVISTSLKTNYFFHSSTQSTFFKIKLMMEKNFGAYNWNRKHDAFGTNTYSILWHDAATKAVLMKHFLYGLLQLQSKQLKPSPIPFHYILSSIIYTS